MGTVPSSQAAPVPPAVLPATHQRNFLWSTISTKRGAMAIFDQGKLLFWDGHLTSRRARL